MKALGLLVALAAAAACNIESYPLCPDCPTGEEDGGEPVVPGVPDASIIDAGPTDDACISSGIEQCDELDNDCDGEVDEGSLPGVGVVCGTSTGECSEGTTVCQDGAIVCDGAVPPSLETCDGLDNDCDGNTDNGDPGGGLACGTNTGECIAGISRCEGGAIACIGEVGPGTEACNGLDEDCDGIFDEGLPSGGACGTTDVGMCVQGSLQCVGGQMQCVGAVGPTLEQCDAADWDCDGNPLNGFDLDNDARNCGTCGNVCQGDNATMRCVTGDCAIAACDPGYYDNANGPSDGCEYGPCDYQGPQEACNLADDDCDGTVDENLVPPDICDSDGECGNPAPLAPTCTASGWVCDYGPTVETDPDGDIVPETLCDGLDNDCDGAVDEAHPGKGGACADGGVGICQGTGTLGCNSADPSGPVICNIDTPGQSSTGESCNNLDDDCDGDVDEGAESGGLHSWIDLGPVEIFQYEASRPDARTATAGAVNVRPCSKPDALPWTSVTAPEAAAACASIGARLCTEGEWAAACSATTLTVPATQGSAPAHLLVMEAEHYSERRTGSEDHQWVFRDDRPGASGLGFMYASPDDGENNNTGYSNQSPRLDYQINVTQPGRHYIWVRGWGEDASSDSLHLGLDGAAVPTADRVGSFDDPDTFEWRAHDMNGNRVYLDIPTAGAHVVNVWMRETGFRVDAILLTTQITYTPTGTLTGPGCNWAYGANCDSYQATTCNGDGYDFDPGTAGDQDGLLSTGSLNACYADHGGASRVYDMSGNVREWTSPRAPGINPLRGGSYNSTAGGLACGFDFTVADDAFFFPNVGFRCCRE